MPQEYIYSIAVTLFFGLVAFCISLYKKELRNK